MHQKEKKNMYIGEERGELKMMRNESKNYKELITTVTRIKTEVIIVILTI